MRWILIDKFITIKKGKYAKGMRCVSRAEGALLDHYPCFPVMPSPLLVEMMAQVGGVLAGATIDYEKEVVLAKVCDAEFPKACIPPMELTIEANLQQCGDDAAVTECKVSYGEELIAKANIFFGLFAGMGEDGKHSVVFSKDFVDSYALRQITNSSEVMS